MENARFYNGRITNGGAGAFGLRPFFSQSIPVRNR